MVQLIAQILQVECAVVTPEALLQVRQLGLGVSLLALLLFVPGRTLAICTPKKMLNNLTGNTIIPGLRIRDPVPF
jgi:hypothetical protein